MYFIVDITMCELMDFFLLRDGEHVLGTGLVPWQLSPVMIADDHKAHDLASSLYSPLGRSGFLVVTHTHRQHFRVWAIPSV